MVSKRLFWVLGYGLWVMVLSGCVVRTYPLTKDRLDQDLTTGNRGYIKGEAPSSDKEKKRPAKRTIQAVEIELQPPIKFESMPKKEPISKDTAQKAEDKEIWGNRGYITESDTSKIAAPERIISKESPKAEKYTVKKGDTLQKISQKFYGTTKKWIKIYEANKDTLSGPNKIYSGQVINIPLYPKQSQGAESLKETKENLK